MRRFWTWISFLPAELAIEASLSTRRTEPSEDWFDADCMFAFAIVIEIGIALAIWRFLRLHGQL